MAVFGQVWTLTKKNLLVVFVRHWFFTTIRAFLAPVIFMFIISYAKNFFVPPSEYGIGSPTPIRSLSNALSGATGNHNKVVFVNNGFTGGDIEAVIDNVSAQVRAAGKNVEVVQHNNDLLTSCASSLRGATACFGAAAFHSSPNEGISGAWNYTLRADGAFGERIFVDQTDNDVEIYVLPLQRAIDMAIASVSGNATASNAQVQEYPFTDLTSDERDDLIQRLFMRALIDILAVAYFIGICGVTYQLTGQMASERELGISQLIEAMTPSPKRWHIQAARLLSNHLAFDILYLPGWIIMGGILRSLAFVHTNVGILIVYNVLAGLALASSSILGASFFNKAQLSGISVTMVSVILAIVAQVAGPFGTGATAILSLLFPSMNYVLFLIYVARFERLGEAASLAEGAPSGPSSLPGIAFWIFLIIQIIVFPILGAIVERWLYGTVSKDRKVTTSSPEHAIVLSNFSKHWTPSPFRQKVLSKLGFAVPETVFAVNDFSIKARKGQILVLLGANGSGKSTTLDAISGLNTITHGSIEIDGTGGLGLCPQKNVLWDELTVYEHVKIFNQLKAAGATDSKKQIEDLVRACDLGHKIKAKSTTLSGGQKRKLQLAMMFTGGSRVCCVDEVSSGLDPLSRRKIWDILLAERGERTFLLTTHFLDEADVLSDYVAILSKGNLKIKGTAVQLKHEVGVGYCVSVPKSQQIGFADSVKRSESEDRVTYWFPNSAEASKFISELRTNDVKDYDIVGPTLEDVFLSLAEEVRENGLEDHVPLGQRSESSSPVPGDKQTRSVASTNEEGMKMTEGRGTGVAKQTMILIHKRFTILKRSYFPYLAAVLVPVITAGLVTLFLKDFSAVGCNPGDQASNPRTYDLSSVSTESILIPIGPSALVDVNVLANRTGLNASSFHLVDSLTEFNNYIAGNFHNVTPGGFFLQPNQDPEAIMAYIGNGDVTFGLVTLSALDNLLGGVSISTSYQSFAVPFSPSAGKTLQLILYFGLAMSVYPAFFALYPCVEKLRKVRALHYSNGIRAGPLWLAYLTFDFLFVLIISAVVTGIFAGASNVWYAPGYLFVVFFLYGLTSTLLCYVVSLFTHSQLACFAFAAGGQAVFFLLYFIMYMSILTYSPAYSITSDLTVANFAYSIITPTGSLLRSLLLTLNEFSLLCQGTSIAPYPGGITVYGGPILYLIVQALVLFTVLLWWDSGYKPSFLTLLSRRRRRNHHKALASKDTDTETIGAISSDKSSPTILDPAVAAETHRVASQTAPHTDSLRVVHLNKFFGRTNHAVQDMTFGIPRGEVFALLGPNGAGKSTTISLVRGDVHPSGGFRDTTPPGDVLISDQSISAHRAAARQHLGVCPQFDAMDSMTVREHLCFYAAARGVPDVPANVDAVLTATGLRRFADRLAHTLSGGNKRKLSLGIALMGNPAVLVLDEPSSGMDAAAKRVMWRTLLGVAAPGRALLITTHSMEEADYLATRVGIMKRRMLALGTGRELGEKWGQGVVVQVVLKSAPNTTEGEMEQVKAWLAQRVHGIEFERWWAKGGAHGLLRFRVRKAGSTGGPFATGPRGLDAAGLKTGGAQVSVRGAADDMDNKTSDSDTAPLATETLDTPGLIQLLEAHREELAIEYYSVSPTTLDEVFLRVVGREEEEEHTSKKKPKWMFW